MEIKHTASKRGALHIQLREKRNRQSLSIHHINPTSRGGVDDETNLTVWPRNFHARWHELFNNMSVDEIIEFIKALNIPNTIFTRERVNKLREEIQSRPKRSHKKKPTLSVVE